MGLERLGCSWEKVWALHLELTRGCGAQYYRRDKGPWLLAFWVGGLAGGEVGGGDKDLGPILLGPRAEGPMASALMSPSSLTVGAGDGAPAGNCARGPGRIALGGQVDFPHGRRQLSGLAQLHQHDVILVGLCGVLGVDEGLRGLDLLAFPAVEPKAAHVHIVIAGRRERHSERDIQREREAPPPREGDGAQREGTRC